MTITTVNYPLSEREYAFQFLSNWIESLSSSSSSFTTPTPSFPLSLVQAMISIAETPRHSLRSHALHLLLRILLSSPSHLLTSELLVVLIQGCVELHNSYLLQSTLLTVIHYLNEPSFRTAKILRDLCVLFDPFINGAARKLGGIPEVTLSTPSSLIHLAVLTTMRSWNGLMLFGKDGGGFYHYLNLLATQGMQFPVLAREILSTLFTLLGIPTPNLLNEDEIEKQSLYWNECSLFVDCLGFTREHSRYSRQSLNVLTLYVSVMVRLFSRANLPEILTMLLQHSSSDVVYLARKLLNVLSFLEDLYLPVKERNTSRSYLMKSFMKDIDDRGVPTESMAVGSSLLYLYPIVQHTTFVSTTLSDYLSWLSLFENILDCMCDNRNLEKPLHAMDYLSDHQFTNFSLLSELVRDVYDNSDLFMTLLRQTTVRLCLKMKMKIKI